MKTIHKYGVKPLGATMMPEGAKIVSAGLQDGATDDQIYVWALVDTEASLEPRHIDWHRTGSELFGVFNFIATLQEKSGEIIHIVEHYK